MFLDYLVSDRAGDWPRMEVSDLRAIGAMPAEAARWPDGAKERKISCSQQDGGSGLDSGS